ncbi:MAG: GNAT family N-acetyltransferase [Acidimicrobiales bacterium]
MGSARDATVRAQAAAVAEAQAVRAQVEVRSLTATAELAAAADLFGELWQTPFDHHILRAFVLSGNYVAGAFDAEERLVGASVAFATIGPEPELHSHITGVAMSHRRSGVGLVMKLHQRHWALERDIELITWTFDPLIRRNAKFNLSRLGATAERYLENVYGDTDDALNGRGESDRLLVRWRLTDDAVVAAAAGTPRSLSVPPGFVGALRQGSDDHPAKTTGPEGIPAGFTCRVPDDIEAMRVTNPVAANAWRLAVRELLAGSLARGCRLLGLTGDGDYIVSPPEAT